MNNNIIQALWIGEEISVIEKLCMASFVANGHEFHLYTYSKLKGVPDGVIIKDANNIIPKSQIFTYHTGSYAGFADWFRWELLCKCGNFYVDTDMICLKPFNFHDDIVFGKEDITHSCPAVIKFPKDHEFARFMVEVCRNPNEILVYDDVKVKIRKLIRRFFLGNRRENIGWGEAGGPVGFTNALNYFDLFELGKPFTYFFPIHFTNWKSIFDDTLKNDLSLFSDTFAVHLWNEMARKEKGFDKNATFHECSLIEYLKRKYLL